MSDPARIALVANERSGGGTTAEDVVRLLESAGADVRRFGLEALDEAARSGAARLVVAGGDGTLGAAAAAAAASGLELAVVPTGTANDFVRALGLPLDVEEAARLAARGRERRRLDLGRMDGRPFLNAVSVGLSPAAARRAGSLKARLGRLAYAVGALRAALGAEAVACRVSCDGEPLFEGRAWQVIVSNTGAFGGGSGVDEADPADGLLDVTVVPAGGRLRLALDGFALRTGRIAGRRGVRQRRGAVVSLDVPEGTPANVDGELVEGGPARLRVERGDVEVVVG